MTVLGGIDFEKIRVDSILVEDFWLSNRALAASKSCSRGMYWLVRPRRELEGSGAAPSERFM